MHYTVRILAAWLVISLCYSVMLAADVLQGTKPWSLEGDPASEMINGIDRFLLKQIEQSGNRAKPNSTRERLARIIGAHDERLPCRELQYVGGTSQPALVGRGEGFEVFAVRWPVVRGIEGEGLLLVPTGTQARRPTASRFPMPIRRPKCWSALYPACRPNRSSPGGWPKTAAASSCRCLIDRADTYSVTGAGRATNQPHREFVYRPAFEMGRHIIGYEVQKVLALVDWFTHEAGEKGDPRIGVIGYGEGGLLALHAGALDPRIDARLRQRLLRFATKRLAGADLSQRVRPARPVRRRRAGRDDRAADRS